MLARPGPTEYVDYYERYIARVPEGDILHFIGDQISKTTELLGTIGEEKAAYRYARDKWSIKQVIGHLNDIERIFQYRALAFARSDKTPLPSIEQDDYVARANFDDRTLASLTDEYRWVRSSGLALFESFDDEILLRGGTASGCAFTVRAIPYILAGHDIHHIDVIRERYL
ncbi:MAG: DinB family protein [Candidatus Krumholzibacteria bacterium]|nr:DinB family protein [Candidatus Krumholzibacteria bacterium]